MLAKDLIQNYYDSLNKKDNTWQDLWSEDGCFMDASKVLNAQGKAAVIESFTPFLRGVESVNVKQMIVDGDYVCAIVSYDYKNSKGEKLHQDVAEVWEVKNEKLARLTIYFDLTLYRNFMKG